ncbi:MAG: S8 family serine peptidase [Bacteroidales bacterium]|nr:S8 family serine peptidase [Bacteroidales bacterium]MBR6930172.1 S8 family serine peptidase [Bacteroidales bacterium]
MKRFTMIVALVLSICSFSFAQRSTFSKIIPDLQEELDKQPSTDKTFSVIITMTDEYDQAQMAHEIQYMKSEERRSYVVDELKRFSKASQSDLLQLLNEGVRSEIVKDVKSFWLFNGISCTTTREMIEALSQRKDIAVIDLDRVVMLPDNEKATEVTEAIRGLAWHVSQVHANDVWAYNGASGYDGTGVVVAIIDTGVNYNHVDLSDHMWNGGDGYPNHGYDFFSKDNDPMDEYGHGTHCAGITAGDGTSGTQTGIAPNATIMALKVFGGAGSEASTDDILDAMSFAVDHGADIVNLSLGSAGASGNAYYRQAFVNMMNANVVASVAAGNEGQKYGTYSLPTNIGSPGNCPSPWHNPDQALSGGQSAAITIGASNRSDRKTTFSSFGPVTWGNVSDYNDYPYAEGSTTETGLIKPDIITPGADIVSCNFQDNSGHVSNKGTSMAAPLASGIMALMLQANPNLTPSQIDQILETTAWPVDFKVKKNNDTGAGRADALACIDAIFTNATQPTNLTLETRGGDVMLTWTASTSAPAGYCIYRDNVQVGTTTETNYTDKQTETGKHVYYVRANDNSNHQSVRSNALVCNIAPYATSPDNLSISWDGENAFLNWDASTTNSNEITSTDLYFTMDPRTAYPSAPNTTAFWGIKYEPEDLRHFIGMSIDQMSICIYSTDLTHTIRIYRGTSFGNTTGEPVYSQSFTPTCGQLETQLVTLDTPYPIDDISEDLWITCSATLGSEYSLPAALGLYPEPSSNCFYHASGDDPNHVVWGHFPDGGQHVAACIKAHLTRTTTYTPAYNVYLDNGSELSNLSVTEYTGQPNLHSGENTYYVTSMIGNNESCPSNDAKIVVIDNTQTENDDITIDNSSVYIINPTGMLTANGSLVSADPTRFILENGAQLIHNSTGVKATVKKVIDPTNGDDQGWNFIASPVVESIEPSQNNGLLSGIYDLYLYEEPTYMWRNYKEHIVDNINQNTASGFHLNYKQGYLYANSTSDTLQFSGTLAPSNSTVSINNLSHSASILTGFNLVGNPYAHNVTSYTGNNVAAECYRMNEYRSNIIVSTIDEDKPLLPAEGFFVKATNENASITFNSSSRNETTQPASIHLDLISDNLTFDRLIVKREGEPLEKLSLRESGTKIFAMKGNQESAVAIAEGNEQAVSFKAEKNGIFTLRAKVEPKEWKYLHLIDNMTGADIDLLATPEYSFEARTDDYVSRFKLVFFAPEDVYDDAPFAYISNGEIRILGKNQDFKSLQIIDMTGHIVINRDVVSNVSTNGLSAGVYVLRLINDNQVKTQKVLVP